MNNKPLNEFEQIQIPHNLNDIVLNTIRRAQRDKKKKRVVLNLVKSSIAVASLLIIFISTINFIPAFAQSINKIPLLGGIAKYFELYHDNGIKEAVENNFIQETAMSVSNNGITASIDGLIADDKKLTIMYSFSVENGYDDLQELLPGEFKITDKNGKLILSSKGSSRGVKELRDDTTGELLDFVKILPVYSPIVDKIPKDKVAKYFDMPDNKYQNKYTSTVFQYKSKNADFNKTHKSTGTIELEVTDENGIIPDELNIEFTKLAEAYYQPDDEVDNQKSTKQFTKKAFIDKNHREAINIDGVWNFKLTLDKAMKAAKPKTIENIKFIAGDIDFNIDKIEEFPTKVRLNMAVGKCNGKAIEFKGLKRTYFIDEKGKKYNELIGETYSNNNHILTANFESFYFDNVKELYLVIEGFEYCYEFDRDNMKLVKDVKVKIK